MANKKIALVAALISINSLALADPLYTGIVTTADHGFYVEVEGGYARLLGLPDKPINSASSQHQVGTLGWGSNLGYAWALDAVSAIGAEVGYSDNGHDKFTGENGGVLKLTSEDIQLLGTFSSGFDSGFNVFVKLGVAALRQKASVSQTITINSTAVTPFSDSKTTLEPMAVLGLGYKITPNINAYIQGSFIVGSYYSDWSQVTATPDGLNKTSAVLMAKMGLSYAFAE